MQKKMIRLVYLSIALVICNWFLQFKVILKAGWIGYKTCSYSFFKKTNRIWDIFKNVWNKHLEKCTKIAINQERPGINPIFWLKYPMSARQMHPRVTKPSKNHQTLNSFVPF